MAFSQQWMTSKLKALPKSRGVKILGNGERAVMICQWHFTEGNNRESTPSFFINITRNGKYAAGTGHCYGCSKNVRDFKVILDPSTEGLDTSIADDEEPDAYVEPLYDEKIDRLLYEEDRPNLILPNAIPWAPGEDWRSIKGRLLTMIGAKLIFEEEYENLMAYLPCVVNDEHIGGIRANLQKRGKRNYFNSPGPWVKEQALFPYDFTRRYIKKLKLNTVVITEGPRDALRSLQMGIPAMSILGTGNYSEAKSDLISNLGVERIITALDGDKAGRDATKKIYDSFRGEFDVKNFNFAKYGKNLDPGNASVGVMKKLRSFVI